jgi:BRCA1-associated protein
VCVMAVPNHMTYADFCRFCGSFIQNMLEMRIVRFVFFIYFFNM